LETPNNYVIVPMLYQESRDKLMERYSKHHNGTPVAEDFRYNSGENTQWLDAVQLRALIKEHVDASFDV